MLKISLTILPIIIMFIIVPLYSQDIYQDICNGNVREQIERWEGKNSFNIIDYVLKLQLRSFEKKHQIIKEKEFSIVNNYFLVIRTEINGLDSVEYQITLREDSYGYGKGIHKLMLIFEHPIGKSLLKQYYELKKSKNNISLEEAASQIRIKRDTVIIDSTFQYYNLINEMYALEFPLIYESLWVHNGTWTQVYKGNPSNDNYSLFQLGVGEYKFPNWAEKLFMAMIDHFNAIDPYPDIKWKNRLNKLRQGSTCPSSIWREP